MRSLTTFVIFGLATLFSAQIVPAQEKPSRVEVFKAKDLKFQISMDKREILVGDAVTLNILLKNNFSSAVSWPYANDELMTGYSVSIRDARGRQVRMKELPAIRAVGYNEARDKYMYPNDEVKRQLSLDAFFDLFPGVYSVSASHMASFDRPIQINSNTIRFRIVRRSPGSRLENNPSRQDNGSTIQWSSMVDGIRYGIMPARQSIKVGETPSVQIVIWNKTTDTIFWDNRKDEDKITVTGPNGERLLSKTEKEWERLKTASAEEQMRFTILQIPSGSKQIFFIGPNRISTAHYNLNYTYEFPIKGKYLIKFERLATKPEVAPPGTTEFRLLPPGTSQPIPQQSIVKPEGPRLVTIGTIEMEVT